MRPEICRPLLEFLRPTGATVVEIGPGGGVLTASLLDAGARVLAFEVDPAWAFELSSRLVSPRLCLTVSDAMDLRWRGLPPGSLVTGNLPYNIATALILRFLRYSEAVERAAFLVQEEVARRLVARPGDPEYGSLSVLVAARSRTRLLGRVKRSSFRPPPRVDGAFVGMFPGTPPLSEEGMSSYERFVRLAFARRRKTLRNSLAAGWGRAGADRLLQLAGLEERVRAESLSPRELLSLYRLAAAEPTLPPAGKC